MICEHGHHGHMDSAKGAESEAGPAEDVWVSAAVLASVLRGMPRCLTDVPAALKLRCLWPGSGQQDAADSRCPCRWTCCAAASMELLPTPAVPLPAERERGVTDSGRCSITWLTARRLAFCHSGGSATTSQPTWRSLPGHSSLASFSSSTSRKPSTGWTGLGYGAAWQPQALEEALSAGSASCTPARQRSRLQRLAHTEISCLFCFFGRVLLEVAGVGHVRLLPPQKGMGGVPVSRRCIS